MAALAGEDPDDGAGEAADQDAEPLQYTRAMVSSCRTPRYFVWKLLWQCESVKWPHTMQ